MSNNFKLPTYWSRILRPTAGADSWPSPSAQNLKEGGAAWLWFLEKAQAIGPDTRFADVAWCDAKLSVVVRPGSILQKRALDGAQTKQHGALSAPLGRLGMFWYEVWVGKRDTVEYALDGTCCAMSAVRP